MVGCSTVPIVDSSFALLPLHFTTDPAVDSVPFGRQMSVTQQADLIAKYMDIDMVPVGRGRDHLDAPATDHLDPGGTRPRTRSWGGRDGDIRQTDTATLSTNTATLSTDTRDRQRDKKKAKPEAGRLGLFGRAVTKKLKPGGKQKELVDSELRQRRKESIGTVTQSTRLSCLTDDMLLDHTQVNSHYYMSVIH